MRRCAFLTMLDPSGFVMDDELAHEPLRALGWQVESVPWQEPEVRWADYEAVVIRSPWDYHAQPDAFLSVLAAIERSGARLENPLDLVRWNLPKTYLRELAARGVATLPTLWRDGLRPGDLERLFDEIGSPEIVVKPVVGAGSVGVHRLDREAARRQADELLAYFAKRPLLAQPLARAVLEEGEYSLFYFNGAHSHTISKTPRDGDFRVQEEYGAEIRRITADAELRAAGQAVLRALGSEPLYARADFVRSNDGDSYWLMELELIEPALYLRMDPEAPARFARALHDRVTGSVTPLS